MDSSAAIPASMQTYLNNCTPQQVQDIVQHIQGLSHPNVARDKPSTKVKSGSVVKKQRTKKAKTTTGGPKRPLNSWMAFRKFYEGSLSPATQKAISTVLSNYWRTDPFHAKWTILAKAYSIMRGDRDKEDAPLDKFLALCAPLMGMIAPGEYQSMMGWALGEKDKDGVPQITRVFTPDPESFPVELTSTTLSAKDLVQKCAEADLMGFGVQSSHSVQGALTMAVQPNAPVSASATTSSQAMSPDNNDSEAQTADRTTASALMQENPNVSDTTVSGPAANDPFDVDAEWSALFHPEFYAVLVTQEAQHASQQGQQDQNVVGGVLSSAAELNNAQQSFVGTDASYPFNNLFSPTANAFNVAFEPAQDNTDPMDNSSFDAHETSVYPYEHFTNMGSLDVDFAAFLDSEKMA